MRVLFWGTPEFAVPALRALAGEGFEVVAVVTQPDRAQGRSRTELLPPPVKVAALDEDIPVLQPETPRGSEFLGLLRTFAPDLSVVVAYGHILRPDVIALPRLGTVNIHASLLPALRGAAPIQAAIRDGLTETGITIMRMVTQLDAGPVIHQLATPIEPDETYGELQLRLAELGAMALIEALALLDGGAATETPQDELFVSYAPKVTRASARIDWTLPAEAVSRTVRAYDPKPGAWCALRDVETRLFGARVVAGRSALPGEVIEINKTGMLVGTGEGAVLIVVVQPAGKRRMAPSELVSGRQLDVGDVLK